VKRNRLNFIGENMAKIELERLMCISCGNCIDVCPEFFEYADDGLSHLKESKSEDDIEEREMEDPGCCRQAEELCPVTIIHVYDS
jgi:ferredoxin